MRCFWCQTDRLIKNGKVRGFQRYRCRDCGYNFTRESPRGYSPETKALAVLRYSSHPWSLQRIAEDLGTTAQSVSRWVQEWEQRADLRPYWVHKYFSQVEAAKKQIEADFKENLRWYGFDHALTQRNKSRFKLLEEMEAELKPNERVF
jgi:transposase-like protein